MFFFNDLGGGVTAPAMRGGYRTSYAVGLLDFLADLPKYHANIISRNAVISSMNAATLPQGFPKT
ncbi:hypothetical protein AD933_00445 [Acetobacter malorum]|uniref:Uncharacterized protein n=1 Tax=Acetobacter malorum TaxID=178901 RepID=A0A149S7C1_9PROT|nr:hypothetical protein AD933_00445 [Acetobacter malorum]